MATFHGLVRYFLPLWHLVLIHDNPGSGRRPCCQTGSSSMSFLEELELQGVLNEIRLALLQLRCVQFRPIEVIFHKESLRSIGLIVSFPKDCMAAPPLKIVLIRNQSRLDFLNVLLGRLRHLGVFRLD